MHTAILSNGNQSLELDNIALRNIALGLQEASLAALADDRYITAITYCEFAATFYDLAGQPVRAERQRHRARDAEACMRLEALQAAEDAAQGSLDIEEV